MISSSSSILVISDSHGNIPALTAALSWASQEQLAQNYTFAAAIFLGDGAHDLAPASAQADFSAPWYKIRGNDDFSFSIPGSMLMEVSGRKLFLAHGNIHNVNRGGQTIAAAAKAAGAEAALFGHTHVPHCSVLDGIFLLNPGSIGLSRSDAGPTFAVLECPAPASGISAPLTACFFCLRGKGGKLGVQKIQ